VETLALSFFINVAAFAATRGFTPRTPFIFHSAYLNYIVPLIVMLTVTAMQNHVVYCVTLETLFQHTNIKQLKQKFI
jgi:hypothetical protein